MTYHGMFATEAFKKQERHCPSNASDDDLHTLENFFVLMYDRSSAATSVDEKRMDLFAIKQGHK